MKRVLFYLVFLLLLLSLVLGQEIKETRQEIIEPIYLADHNSNEMVNVIILLNYQPLYSISNKEFKKSEQELIALQGEIREILEIDLSPEHIERLGAKKVHSEVLNSLSENEKLKLKIYQKNYEAELTQIKDNIVNKQVQEINASQSKVLEIVKDCNGTIVSKMILENSIAALIPERCVKKLMESKDVMSIFEDKANELSLSTSTKTILSPSFTSLGYLGSGASIAVIDTGIDPKHPKINVSFSKVFHSSASGASNYADNSTDPDDYQGHGTHVAGIVSSLDSIYTGVAPDATLINGKACYANSAGSGLCFNSDGRKAMDWAIETAGAQVISRSITLCSIGSSDCDGSRFLDGIVDSLGVHVVNAAGNSGSSDGTVSAVLYNGFSVGATKDSGTSDRSDDSIASYSSRGYTSDGRVKPDIAAPGSSITSLAYNWETGSDTTSKSGTSMAAPHVAGSIGLLIDYFGFNPSPIVIRSLLYNTAQSNSTFSDKEDFGWGYIDLDKAYSYIDDYDESSLSEGEYVLYRVNFDKNAKATLAWNRHVTYADTSNPSEYYTLNDLDLYLYSEDTNSLADFSISGVDNVEQVEYEGFIGSGVVKVLSYDTEFSHGKDKEDYSLATLGNLEKVSGIELNITYDDSKTFYDNSSFFNLNVGIENNGELAAHNIDIGVKLADGLEIISGPEDYDENIGSLHRKNSTNLNLTVYHSGYGTYENNNVTYTSKSYNETFSKSTFLRDIKISDDDSTGPIISGIDYPSTNNSYTNYLVQAIIVDESGIDSVLIYYDYDGDGDFEGSMNMTNVSNSYSIELPSSSANNIGKNLTFYIFSTDDDSDSDNDSSNTTSSEYKINIFNSLPSIDAYYPINLNQSILVDSVLNFSFNSSDMDGQNITQSWNLNGVEVGTDFIYTYSSSSTTNDIVSLTISDGFDEVSVSWNITVISENSAPVIDSYTPNNLNPTYKEDVTIFFNFSASDPNGDIITQEWYKNNLLQTTSKTYSPFFDHNTDGVYNITLLISDGNLTDTITWNLTINYTNRAPVWDVKPSDDSIFEDSSLAQAFDASDPDGSAITYFTNNSEFTVTSGELRWTPKNNFNGKESVNVSASDGEDSITAVVTITVIPVNDDVELTTIDNQIAYEDHKFNLQLNFTDIDNDSVSFGGGDSLVIINKSGYISFTPLQSHVGSRIVTFNVSDGSSADSQEVNFTIININDAPVIDTLPNISVNESNTVTIFPTASDEDNDTLTFSYDKLFNSSGVWETNYSSSGIYTITVTVNDGNLSDSGNFTLIVNEDADEDGVPDFADNSTFPSFIGTIANVTTNFNSINLKLSDGLNSTSVLSGVVFVNLSNGNQTIVSFPFNFTNKKLNLANLSVYSSNSSHSQGLVVFNGVDIISGYSKVLYIKDVDIDISTICVKDTFIEDITEISTNCDKSSEKFLNCDGVKDSGFTCVLSNGWYQVTGLSHSGAKELKKSSTPSSGDSGSSGSSGGGGGGGGGGGSSKSSNTNESSTEDSELEEAEEVETDVANLNDTILDFEEVSQEIIPSQEVEVGNEITGAAVGTGLLNKDNLGWIVLIFGFLLCILFISSFGKVHLFGRGYSAWRIFFRSKYLKIIITLFLVSILIFTIFGTESSDSQGLPTCLNGQEIETGDDNITGNPYISCYTISPENEKEINS